MTKNKLVLFDIDYTLFDTNTFRTHFQTSLAALLHEPLENFKKIARGVEEETKKKHGFFETNTFVDLLLQKIKKDVERNEVIDVFSDKNLFSSSIREDAVKTLQTLSQANILIGIFSVGENFLQQRKIAVVESFLEKKHIHIVTNKFAKLPELLPMYKNYTIYMVDDILDVLTFAKDIDSSVYTIWFQPNESMEKHGGPDITVKNLTEIIPIIV